MNAFYRIEHDRHTWPYWHLNTAVDSSGTEVSIWAFTRARIYDGPQPLHVPLYADGPHVDFNFDTFMTVITPPALNAEMQQRFGIRAQRIPVTVESAEQDFEILNVLDRVPCIDVGRSEFMKWGPEDGRPDKVGQYRMFTRLRIDPAMAQGHHLFQIAEWFVALVASQQLKDFLQQRDVTGISFLPLTDAAFAALPSAEILPFPSDLRESKARPMPTGD